MVTSIGKGMLMAEGQGFTITEKNVAADWANPREKASVACTESYELQRAK